MAKKPPSRRAKPVKPSLKPLQPFVDRGATTDELQARLAKQGQATRNPLSDPLPSGSVDDLDNEDDDSVSVEDNAIARKQFQAAMEANAPWSTQAAIDLKWSAGVDGDRSYQWPAVVQQARDLEQRPFETINRIPSFIKQITNQQRQAGPSMQVVPLKGIASQQAAEAREGLLRHTMLISEGEVQVDTIFEDMATHGKGWAEVVNRYENEDDDTSDDQDLYVEWRDPFTVFIDPAAVKLDKSDMKYAFVPYDIPTDDYNKLYPESTIAKMGDASWHGLEPGDKQRWFPNGCVRVAKYYTVEEEVQPKREGSTRELKRKWVVKRIINALEVLETVEMKRGGVALKRIPLVPMLGDRYVIEGKEDYRGMVRLARGPQQMLNFWITSLTEAIAFTMRSPVLVGWSQLEGFEAFWNKLHLPNLGYLPYKDKNADGSPANQAPPQRIQGEPGNIQAITVAINIAKESLQEIMNLYDPSLGKGKADQSGSAINALQQQGEIGNSNYIDNAKRFYRSLGRLLLQMYPVYYDTPRVRQIVDKQGRSITIAVHAGDENKPNADDLKELSAQEIADESIFDMAVGQFDIAVATGPNFLSQRQEANANMLQIMKMAPPLMPMLIDKFFENSDFPGNSELAERAKRTISKPFQSQDQDDPMQQIGQMKQLLDQAMQQHDLLAKELQAKTDYIKTDQAKYGAQVEIKKAEFLHDERMQELKNASSMYVADKNAETKGVISRDELLHDKIALGMEQAHEAALADVQRGHEVGMSHAGAAQDAAQSDQEHQQALAQGAQPPPVDPNAAPASEGAPA